MLKGTFFEILRQNNAPGSVKVLLSINKDHEILKGHFPGQPVVPGVCMIQMIKELVMLQTSRKLKMVEADNIKFLSVLDPTQNNEVEADIAYNDDDGLITLNASLFCGSVIFFKFKATLRNS